MVAGAVHLVRRCEGIRRGVAQIHGALAIHHVAVALTQRRGALDAGGHRFIQDDSVAVTLVLVGRDVSRDLERRALRVG